MILRMTFEEITTLNAAAERMLGGGVSQGAVLAPPEALAELEARLPLEGDISVRSLSEQNRLMDALDTVVEHLHRRMDTLVLEQHVGSDDAVNAYFDYANVITTRAHLAGIGEEMMAVVDIVTAEDASDALQDLEFPD